MAPRQCPACGRFLKRELVEQLVDGERTCPRCEATLNADMFDDDDPSSEATGASVRPPDLAPAQVREEPDVLADWDAGADAAEVASWNRDRAPFPIDAVVVLGGTVLGALVGAAAPGPRLRGAAIGGGVGFGVTATVRQVWRLRDGSSV